MRSLQNEEVPNQIPVIAEDKGNKIMSSEGMEATEQEMANFADEDEAVLDDTEKDDAGI